MVPNVDPEVLVGFQDEVKGYLPAVRDGIARYRASTDQVEALFEAYRHVHTIKGAASMVGLAELSHVAYHLEAALEGLAEGGRPMTANEEALYLWTLVQIETYLDAAREGTLPENALREEVERRYARLSEEPAGEAALDDAPEDEFSFDAPDWQLSQEEPIGERPLPVETPAISEETPSFDELPSWEDPVAAVPPQPLRKSAMGLPPPRVEEAPPWRVEQLPVAEVEPDEEEISPELVEVFALESQDHLRTIGSLLPVLEQDPTNREAIQGIRRSAHTLKGAAGMVGFKGITQLAHRMEDLLDLLYEGGMAATPEIVQLLFASTDALEDMAGGRTDKTKLNDLYGSFTALLSQTAQPAAPAVAAVPAVEAKPLTETGNTPEAVEADASLAAGSRRASQFVRIPIDRLDELVKLVSELVINRSTFEQRMTDFARQIGELRHSSNRLRSVSHRLETDFEASALAGAGHTRGERNGPRRGVLSGQTHGFDELEFDRYTEFHLLSRALAETTNDIQTVAGELNHVISDFDGYLNRQGRHSSEIEDKLMRLRMVPLSTVATRLHRTVRNVADQMGKDVELVLEGEGTELDKTVLEAMGDPLLHLLRNAVDHGIEPPELRQAKGKPGKGVIRLRAFHEGNQVVLQITDDGAGVDPERVRATAVRRGVLSASEAAALPEAELLALVFQPGFSTAKQISEVSGRGVGLDVVKAHVSKLKGSVLLESSPDKGAIFTIRLPMTLAIARALLVKAHQETFALPLDAVRQILRAETDQVEHVGTEPVIRLGGKVYPVVYLGKALGLRQLADESVRHPPVIVLNTGVKDVALVVDRLLGGREVVVKSLGSHLRNVRGVTGATLMGDGSVVLILNPTELTGSGGAVGVQIRQRQATAAVESKALSVLVVDDSPSVRRVVTTLLKSAGWSVTSAKDGLDALDVLHQSAALPDVCLCDIEMPRMDGYDLLAALKGQEAYRAIPVIMVTSRSGEKHRRKALDLGATNYLVKPYQDDVLLATIRQAAEEARQPALV